MKTSVDQIDAGLPQTSPTTLKLDVLTGAGVQPYTFEVRQVASRVGVGMVSATLGLDGHLSLDACFFTLSHRICSDGDS